MCGTWFIHVCDVTHSNLNHMIHNTGKIDRVDEHLHAATHCITMQHTAAHSYIYVWTRLMQICDMTHSYVRHDSFILVTWLIHTWDMTHSYVRHASFILETCLTVCATRRIHMWDMIHSSVWHDSCTCVTWLIMLGILRGSIRTYTHICVHVMYISDCYLFVTCEWVIKYVWRCTDELCHIHEWVRSLTEWAMSHTRVHLDMFLYHVSDHSLVRPSKETYIPSKVTYKPSKETISFDWYVRPFSCKAKSNSGRRTNKPGDHGVVCVRCSEVQFDAVWCSMLRCGAVCCSVMQCVADSLQSVTVARRLHSSSAGKAHMLLNAHTQQPPFQAYVTTNGPYIIVTNNGPYVMTCTHITAHILYVINNVMPNGPYIYISQTTAHTHKQRHIFHMSQTTARMKLLYIRDDVNLAQLVRARDCQSWGRHFDSSKDSKNRKPKSTWIWGT